MFVHFHGLEIDFAKALKMNTMKYCSIQMLLHTRKLNVSRLLLLKHNTHVWNTEYKTDRPAFNV